MTTKIERRVKIKYRVRNKISGTTECPRMSVFRSNKQIYVQVIDDKSGKTLVSASSLKMEEKVNKKELKAIDVILDLYIPLEQDICHKNLTAEKLVVR